ncbi:zinc-binding dehydrogenase [Actinomadura sp. LD22]|uniref:Zinc-binding dehydrogenase n=1 Tax=Actinomadura physcomitrii TaxID=2650748 RepID=A0A6I4M3C1_9ACTN|nr:NADP-dependent oxidoreductase [Actinomadura physcomitrii]MVZ98844.1 zinc-binding dehydrogenase [Actinomadura physcomitrii]
MKAIRAHGPGDPGVLVLDEIPVPEPGPGDVLIRVRAACLNPPDWYARRDFAMIPDHLFAGERLRVSFPWIPGSDASGVVAAVGPGVTDFSVGDEVFGLIRFPEVNNGGRAYAEYTTAPAAHLARKPPSVDHVHAAAVPMAGLTAYQFLVDRIRLPAGRTVLVNGAAGGVGHFAVQLARLRGARVIAVASSRHEGFLRDLGADEYVDYTATAAEDAVRDADVVIDTVGGPDAHRFLKTVKDGGTIGPVFPGDYHPEEAARRGIEIRGGQVHSDGGQMAELAALLADGSLRAGIDSVYDLADAAKAHERAETGHIQGKIVLSVP